MIIRCNTVAFVSDPEDRNQISHDARYQVLAFTVDAYLFANHDRQPGHPISGILSRRRNVPLLVRILWKL